MKNSVLSRRTAMYKLIAIDMDGTLLKNDRTISEKTIAVIKKASSMGVRIVLATGRPLNGIKPYLKALDLIHENDYAITYNGAVVQNTKTEQVVAKQFMEFADVYDLYGLSQKLKLNIHAFTPTGCITPKNNCYTQLEAEVNSIPLDIVDFSSLSNDTEIIKMLMVEDPPILEAALTSIPKEFHHRYTIVKSAPYFLEFLHKTVNKGVGVELLAKKLSILPEEIICIGDAGNDVHMIQFAGLGVAMGNAFNEVKALADYVTLTNEEDGVAHVIEKFILEKA